MRRLITAVSFSERFRSQGQPQTSEVNTRHDPPAAPQPVSFRKTFMQQIFLVAVMMSFYSIFTFHAVPRPNRVEHVDLMEVSRQYQMDCWCDSSKADSALISLSQPWMKFGSDHWFHISEYYLARTREIRPMVPQNKTLLIVTPTQNFFEQITDMTMLLLVLAFTEGNVKVKVIPPLAVQKVMANIVVVDPNSPSFNYDPSMGTMERLFRDKRFQDINPRCTCATFVGEFGPAPVERGYWFGSEEEVQATRQRLSVICDMKEEPRTKNKMVVYQRNSNRKFQKFESMIETVEAQFGPEWEIEVILHDNARHPCTMYNSFRTADVFLTVHGFQTIAVLFMPPLGLVYEVFPYKYWKVGYAPFVKEYGLTYHWLMSPPCSRLHKMVLYSIPLSVCMRSFKCRKFSRNEDVYVDDKALQRIIITSKQVAVAKHLAEIIVQSPHDQNNNASVNNLTQWNRTQLNLMSLTSNASEVQTLLKNQSLGSKSQFSDEISKHYAESHGQKLSLSQYLVQYISNVFFKQ